MLQVQTVVFPTDDSPCAEAARPLAERFAQRHGARLHVLRVELVPPAGDLRFDPFPVPDAPSPEGDVVEVRRRFPSAADAILLYADDVDADVIVMGTHGRSGWNRFTLGSTTERVLRQAPCAVLTVGPEADADAAGPVLAPLTFESISDVALETAVAAAEAGGTPLVAVHVVEPVTFPAPYALTADPLDQADLVRRLDETLRQWTSAYEDGLRVPIVREVRRGAAAFQILEAADEHGAGLIVQASHGRRGIGRWLLGSVAEEVVRRATCPVLTIRMGAAPLVPAGEEAEMLPVPTSDWRALFDALSTRAAEAPHAVSLAVVSPDAEGTVYAGARLVGVTYDERDDAVEVMTEGGEHHVVRPFAVRTTAGAWTLDAARDGSAPGPWVLDVVRSDGARERITIRPVTDAVPA